ncbi:MAG: hypothetical protein E7493_12680 [Ruminococcus albus]|nr:hypothetical protein [Ruminococcus albus]
MKIKAAISALLTAVMLTACGQTEQPVSDRVDVSAAETAVTTSAYSEDITTSAETTTTTTVTTTIADEDSSAVVSSTPSSTQRTVSSTSKAATGKAATTTKKSSTTTRQSSANGGTINNNNNVSGNSGGAAAQAQAHQSSSGGTTAARQTQAPVTTTMPAPVVTAAPPQTTTTTTTTQYVPEPEPQPEPEPVQSNSIVDLDRTDDQMWSFLVFYPINYDELYRVGQNLEYDGTEYGRARAVCQYAYNLGGENCIEHALNAYFIAQGAGLECYIARSSKYDWYGHVANVININGNYYLMEPQANIAVAPDTYAQMGTASDGSTISYPDGLDIVSDIYENHYSFDIRHDLWITETEIKEFDEETGWWHSV